MNSHELLLGIYFSNELPMEIQAVESSTTAVLRASMSELERHRALKFVDSHPLTVPGRLETEFPVDDCKIS